jgi:Transport protein particle (TRAPP) component
MLDYRHLSWLILGITMYLNARYGNPLTRKVGIRELELLSSRDRNLKREIRLLPILLFINTQFWKNLFGKAADSLEKGTDNEGICCFDF